MLQKVKMFVWKCFGKRGIYINGIRVDKQKCCGREKVICTGLGNIKYNGFGV